MYSYLIDVIYINIEITRRIIVTNCCKYFRLLVIRMIQDRDITI